MAPRLLTSPQAAERLGLPVQALYKLRDADEGLSITQTGLQVGYQLEDIQAYERREMLALVEKTLAAERPLPLIRAMAQLLRSPPPADGWPVPTPSPKPKPVPPSAPPKRVPATEPAAADAPALDPPAPAVHTPPSSMASES